MAAATPTRSPGILAAWYDQFGGQAYALAVRMLGDGAAAADVVETVFLEHWNAAEAKADYDRAIAAHINELNRRRAGAGADHLLLRGGADPIRLLAGWLRRRRRLR